MDQHSTFHRPLPVQPRRLGTFLWPEIKFATTNAFYPPPHYCYAETTSLRRAKRGKIDRSLFHFGTGIECARFRGKVPIPLIGEEDEEEEEKGFVLVQPVASESRPKETSPTRISREQDDTEGCMVLADLTYPDVRYTPISGLAAESSSELTDTLLPQRVGEATPQDSTLMVFLFGQSRETIMNILSAFFFALPDGTRPDPALNIGRLQAEAGEVAASTQRDLHSSSSSTTRTQDDRENKWRASSFFNLMVRRAQVEAEEWPQSKPPF